MGFESQYSRTTRVDVTTGYPSNPEFKILIFFSLIHQLFLSIMGWWKTPNFGSFIFYSLVYRMHLISAYVFYFFLAHIQCNF